MQRKCAIRFELIMFQFLSTLEVRKLEKLWLHVPSYLETQFYALKIDYTLPPEST